MKKLLLIGTIVVTLSSVAYAYSGRGCSACKNCKYCKHCAKEGGCCGVCK